MAIHPEHPGLCAEVVINDEALKEYDDEEANEDRRPETITTYAQVDSEAQFGVRYTIPSDLTGEYGVRSRLLLDGKKMCTYVHPRRDFDQDDVIKYLDKFYTTMNGSNYVQHFRFAQLQIGDSDDCSNNHCT
jgi:hypothetical protein